MGIGGVVLVIAVAGGSWMFGKRIRKVSPLIRVPLGVLGILLVLAVVDPVIPLALIFWQQTVPITDAMVRPLAKVFPPMTAAVVAVWTGAAVIGAAWLYGMWTWIRPRPSGSGD